jgi:predicted nucleic acid-binding protein
MQTILIDTGPLVALFHEKDNYHLKITNFLIGKPYRFVTTLAVFAEVLHFLSRVRDKQDEFFELVNHQGLIMTDINQHDMPRIAELMKKYDDLPMDFADATLVVAAEKSGLREIISLDSDFDIYRLPGREKIHNVFHE